MAVCRGVRSLAVWIASALAGPVSPVLAASWQDRESVQGTIIANSDIDRAERFWRSSPGFT